MCVHECVSVHVHNHTFRQTQSPTLSGMGNHQVWTEGEGFVWYVCLGETVKCPLTQAMSA